MKAKIDACLAENDLLDRGGQYREAAVRRTAAQSRRSQVGLLKQRLNRRSARLASEMIQQLLVGQQFGQTLTYQLLKLSLTKLLMALATLVGS